MRRFVPAMVAGAMAVSFSALTFAQNTRDNVHYNIHQKGAQNTSTDVLQSGTQNQSAIGSGNQQSQQYGKGNSASQGSSSAGAGNEHNRQYGDSDRQDKGKHKGWSKNRKDDDDRQSRNER